MRAQPDAIADSRSYTEPNARAYSRPHAIPNYTEVPHSACTPSHAGRSSI